MKHASSKETSQTYLRAYAIAFICIFLSVTVSSNEVLNEIFRTIFIYTLSLSQIRAIVEDLFFRDD